MSEEVLADPAVFSYMRYQNATRIWYIKREKKENDLDHVNAGLFALKSWSRLDTADKRILKENNFFRGSNFASDLKYLLTLNIANVDNAMVARSAAYCFDSVHEVNEAKYFYEKAVAFSPEKRSVLWQALNFAEKENLPEFAASINAAIEKAYAGEPDEMIKGMGRILPKVVASANDPGRHLKDLENGTFHIKYFAGKIYRSTISLPNALATGIWEFLKNDMANYYEWKAYLGEERSAEQKGPIREKYDAICAEVRNIYPDIPVIFDYNDDRHFSIQITPAVKLQVYVYDNSSNKDIVSLTVISEMPKSVP